MLYKGLFWLIDDELICKKLGCDTDGNLLDTTAELTAKNGLADNHKRVWQTLPKSITHGQAFDYYPRGRVEIRNEKATVFLSPYICTEEIISKITDEFHLSECRSVRAKADGSFHYQCHYDKK